MELKIILINAMKYIDKESGKQKLRFSYIPFEKDALRNDEKFKGFTELGGYVDNVDAFECLDKGDFMQEATLIGEERPNPRNPFKKTMKLTTLKTKNATISLL